MKCFLAACLVQSEFGDFDEDDEKCQTTDYIDELGVLPPGTDNQVGCQLEKVLEKCFKFLHNFDTLKKLLEQVKKYHRQRVGQRPFESDYALLEKAKQIETYGVTLVECRDGHQVPCRMSPSPKGLVS